MNLWKKFLDLFFGDTTPPDPVEVAPRPEPAVWLRSDGFPATAPLTARHLRSSCKAMVVSSSAVAYRANLTHERLRAVLLEREHGTSAGLRWPP